MVISTYKQGNALHNTGGLQTLKLQSRGTDLLLHMVYLCHIVCINLIVFWESLPYDMGANCGSLIKDLNLCH